MNLIDKIKNDLGINTEKDNRHTESPNTIDHSVQNREKDDYDLTHLKETVWSYESSESDRQKSFIKIKQLADEGNITAQKECAEIYSLGGRGWYDVHDEKGNRIYFAGFTIVKRDIQKAISYYKMASNEGDIEAKLSLAMLYMDDENDRLEGDPINQKRAFDLYMECALQGNRYAMTQVGFFYCMGKYGVQRNIEEGSDWLEKAAKSGDDFAIDLLRRHNPDRYNQFIRSHYYHEDILLQLEQQKNTDKGRTYYQELIDERINLIRGMDLVFCIDCTSTMEPLLNTLSNNINGLYEDIFRALEAEIGTVHLRVRLILFRSFESSGIYSMIPTDFYTLPIQSETFTMTVQSIRAAGGFKINNKYNNDRVPNDALESVALALKSDWADNLLESHRIVIVMTDNRSRPIGFNRERKYYPSGMPNTLEELEKQWSQMAEADIKNRKQHIILMTPDVYPWNRIREEWKHVIFHECDFEQGLKELDYAAIIKDIVTSETLPY